MTIEQVFAAAPTGTVIPKPAAKLPFRVKGFGTRRGERALIYSIPNHREPSRPHEKGITASEFTSAYRHLMASGEFTRSWFNQHLSACAAEGSCNFTTLGGLLQHAGLAEYASRGVYRRHGAR